MLQFDCRIFYSLITNLLRGVRFICSPFQSTAVIFILIIERTFPMKSQWPNPFLDLNGKPIPDNRAKGPAVRPFPLVKPDKQRPAPEEQFVHVNATPHSAYGITAKPLPPLPTVVAKTGKAKNNPPAKRSNAA